jgi:hypothetical protein
MPAAKIELLSRIYQGRVLRAELLSGTKKNLEAVALENWEDVLGAHHGLFQAAVNYYLLALAAAAGPDHAALRGIREQMGTAWEPFRGKGGRMFSGMRAGLTDFLEIGPNADLEEAMTSVLEGALLGDAGTLAVGLLLEKAQGDSGIRDNGRGYFPKFCSPKKPPNWDFSPEALGNSTGATRLKRLLREDLTEETRARLAAEVKLSWVVKVDADKPPRTGKAAREKLKEAITFFEASLEPGIESRHGNWLKGLGNAAELLAELHKQTEGLTQAISIPVNLKAAHERTFGTLLFQHFPSAFTQGLLAEILGEAKEAKAKKAGAAAKDAEPVESVDFGRLGDDPIKLARGSRGYVFRAFTALPGWAGKENAAMAWREFDIAAFKEALKVLNQFRAKTVEREEKRVARQRELAWMLGTHEGRWKGQGETAEAPARLAGDPRFELLQRLAKDPAIRMWEENAEAEYRFSERALRGWEEIVGKWNGRGRVKPGEDFTSEKYNKLKTDLDDYQKNNAGKMGSATLFNQMIAEPEYWPIWRTMTEAEAAEQGRQGWSEEVVRDFGRMQELQEEIEHFGKAIRFTPADAVQSRRLFMFSDLTGSSAWAHVAGQAAVDVSLAVRGTENQWEERRVRLQYSAPRLRRDGLIGNAPGEVSHYLSPMLQAFEVIGSEMVVQDFSSCAVALMPEPGRGKDPVRYLLNFPLSLDVTAVPGRAERVARWQGQFNGMKKELGHLHWPGTLDVKYLERAWWKRVKHFTVLSVDLGQRVAAASAVIEVQVDAAEAWQASKVTWKLGEADGHEWQARLKSLKMLRLPGEDAEVWDGREGRFRQEKSGSAGRLALDTETAEAENILNALGLLESLRLRSLENPAEAARDWDKFRYFSKQNDHLLYALRRAQGRLMKLQRWLHRLGVEDAAIRENTLQEIKEPGRGGGGPDLLFEKMREAAELGQEELRTFLKEEILRMQDRVKGLPDVLIRIADRVVPLRGKAWHWKPLEGDERLDREKKLNFRLIAETDNGNVRMVRGQRGLSMERIEQLEELRRRCQSLNRALKRAPGEKAKFGRSSQDEELPDPCPDILTKLEHIREQRVDQTAHLILAEALGLRLKGPSLEKAHRESRKARDVHGEYEVKRVPVDFIVLEDLQRYRTTQGRAPSENSRLMKWCHRAVVDKLMQLAEPFGLTVILAPAAYTSRFCSRSGVAGFRAREVGPGDEKRYPFHDLLKRAQDPKREPTEEARKAEELFRILKQLNQEKTLGTAKTLLWPQPGGPIFVPAAGSAPVMQADLNAAINIGLRALASPQAIHLLHKVRTEKTPAGELVPKQEGNKRELALFGKKGAAFSGIRMEEFKAGASKPNLFFDAAGIAKSERVGHPALGKSGCPLAGGRSLWGAVKERQHARCLEMNRRRNEKDLEDEIVL